MFNVTATHEIYTFPYTTLFRSWWRKNKNPNPGFPAQGVDINRNYDFLWDSGIGTSTNSTTETYRGSKANSRSEEHTSELQSRRDLVCRLLLEKKKYTP